MFKRLFLGTTKIDFKDIDLVIILKPCWVILEALGSSWEPCWASGGQLDVTWNDLDASWGQEKASLSQHEPT